VGYIGLTAGRIDEHGVYHAMESGTVIIVFDHAASSSEEEETRNEVNDEEEERGPEQEKNVEKKDGDEAGKSKIATEPVG
jgi:hypothetical protein